MSRLFILSFICGFFFSSCQKHDEKKKTIAISHSGIIGDWGRGLYRELQFELTFYENDVDYIFLDAGNDYVHQCNDIREAINKGVDVLVVFPSYPDSLVQVLDEAYQKGIKIVLADRASDKIKYHNFVGTNDVQIGQMAAEYILANLNGNISVVELMGPSHSITANQRHAGFAAALKHNGNISVDHVLYGNWNADDSFKAVDSVLSTGYVPDVIFAHNDMQAYNARLACRKHHVSPIIIGVDGVALAGGGVDMVLNGDIDATFYNPTAAKESVKNAMALLRGEHIEETEWLDPFLIDKSNATPIKRQFKLLNEQYDAIAKQRVLIADQKVLLKNQKFMVLLSLAAIMMLVFVVVYTIISLVTKMRLVKTIQSQKLQIESQVELQYKLLAEVREKGRLLKEQKDEIEAQRDSIYAQNQELAAYGTEMENLVEERAAELKLALEKARESDRLKTAFLSNLSHEIRTPLNAIIGFSDLFCVPDKEMEERMGLQRVIKRNSQELLDLIEHIIELSLLTTGQILPELKACPLQSILAKTYADVQAELDEGTWHRFDGVGFDFEKGSDIMVLSDCEKVNKIVGHLLQNAFKHTHKGNVAMGWHVLPDQKKVRVYVRDSGVGIPDEYKEVVFDMFRKVESHSLVLYRGAGMGLTIVKHLAEMLGFKIKFESEVGNGSLFWFDMDVYTSPN